MATPTIRSFAGTFAGANDHDYFVESELRLPLITAGPVVAGYHYRESTPFLEELGAPQAEVLARREEGEVNIRLGEYLYLLTVGGYRSTYKVDRNGSLKSYTLGAGFSSGPPRLRDRFYWSVAGGPVFDSQGLDSQWWADLHGQWWAIDFAKDRYLEAPYWGSLSLVADLETVDNNGVLGSFFRFGPALQVRTANGNRAQLEFLWYHNDNNPFLGVDENAFLFGLDVTSPLDRDDWLHAATRRERGWLPLVWGAYDLGFAATRHTTRFEMNVELVDIDLGTHPWTAFIWYESRQEYRQDDYNNIAYSVTLGVQTPIGLASILSHDDPLIFGADFLHRSDHALDPNISGELDNGSHNLLPRLRLQTVGWDLPYRDPHIYDRQTAWLNIFDWRVTAGWDINDNRQRGKEAGQLGLNWDIGTVQGYVGYLRGQYSFGNETPDWMAECGVRRPAGRVFARFERYGIKNDIARGNTFTVGVGVNL
jgi:hypothetical protein